MAFTAGLLHDIGKIVLSNALESRYTDLIRAVLEFDRSLQEAEKELLGVHHAEIGGRLLARWNFPASLVLAVSWHHMPQGANPYQKLAAATYLGNLLAYALGRGYGHTAFAFRNRPEVLPSLGLKEDVLPELLIKTHDHLDEIQALFGTVV
jgi:HD-like signal output (HDOD) protein